MALNRLEKELDKLCNSPSKGGTSFNNIKRVLGLAGFVEKTKRGKGSHHAFQNENLKHPDSQYGFISFPEKDGVIKVAYVKKICKVLNFLVEEGKVS